MGFINWVLSTLYFIYFYINSYYLTVPLYLFLIYRLDIEDIVMCLDFCPAVLHIKKNSNTVPGGRPADARRVGGMLSGLNYRIAVRRKCQMKPYVIEAARWRAAGEKCVSGVRNNANYYTRVPEAIT